MSLFSEYIRVVIGAAVICGMVTLLVPKGHYEKAFRLITGVFLLFCMVTPVSRGLGSLKDFDFSVDFEDVPTLEEGAWGQSAMVMEQQLKNRIGECVRTIIGEDALAIEGTVSFMNEQFSVGEVTITVGPEHAGKFAAIRDYVKKETGIEPEVIS